MLWATEYWKSGCIWGVVSCWLIFAGIGPLGSDNIGPLGPDNIGPHLDCGELFGSLYECDIISYRGLIIEVLVLALVANLWVDEDINSFCEVGLEPLVVAIILSLSLELEDTVDLDIHVFRVSELLFLTLTDADKFVDVATLVPCGGNGLETLILMVTFGCETGKLCLTVPDTVTAGPLCGPVDLLVGLWTIEDCIDDIGTTEEFDDDVWWSDDSCDCCCDGDWLIIAGLDTVAADDWCPIFWFEEVGVCTTDALRTGDCLTNPELFCDVSLEWDSEK